MVKGSLRTVKSIVEILASGVVGYRLHLSKEPAGLIEKFSLQAEAGSWLVSKEALPGVLSALSAASIDVDLIEPCRENLEDFFLKIVGQS